MTNKPATPLPLGDVTFDGDGQFRVAGCNPTNEDKHEIAFRATAYPKLVEALRNLSAGWYVSDPSTVKSVNEARALLRELGEE